MLVKRFIKGVFELWPPMVSYKVIWDVNIVLEYFSNFYPDHALATKQRIQTLHAINVHDINDSGSGIVIPIRKLLKT